MNFDCLICGYSSGNVVTEKVRDSSEFKVMRCSNCSHIQLYPTPSQELDRKFYDENTQLKNWGGTKNIELFKQNSYHDTIRRVHYAEQIFGEKEKNKYKMLEIGAGYGFFVQELLLRDYNIIGQEISTEKILTAQKHYKVILKDLDYNEFQNHFDGIFMFQVLEHIIDPIKFLKMIRNSLKNNGKLIIEVPNASDINLLNIKSYNDWYWQRAHIHYFNKKSLRHVLYEVGFKDINFIPVQRYSIVNMMNWYLNRQPQLENPIYYINEEEYKWIDDFYKDHLMKNFICDTIVAIGKN
ncbi:MAG: class I SAM-dependent methyltransferase [Candidatus Zhuqueibacterota bacterium]